MKRKSITVVICNSGSKLDRLNNEYKKAMDERKNICDDIYRLSNYFDWLKEKNVDDVELYNINSIIELHTFRLNDIDNDIDELIIKMKELGKTND